MDLTEERYSSLHWEELDSECGGSLDCTHVPSTTLPELLQLVALIKFLLKKCFQVEK